MFMKVLRTLNASLPKRSQNKGWHSCMDNKISVLDKKKITNKSSTYFMYLYFFKKIGLFL